MYKMGIVLSYSCRPLKLSPHPCYITARNACRLDGSSHFEGLGRKTFPQSYQLPEELSSCRRQTERNFIMYLTGKNLYLSFPGYSREHLVLI
jgi:hypothetical protein